jgi:hypothetical protein
MDYVESVMFVTKDEKWIEKIGLGALAAFLSIFVVGALALAGWSMETFRRVLSGDPEKLPGWENWSAYLTDGLKWFGVAIVWYIPVAILGAIWKPLGTLASIPMGFLMIGAFIILTRTGDWMRALNPMNAWALLNKNLNQWIITAVIIWAASVVASVVGTLALVIGLLVTTPWLVVAMGNLIGRVYVETGAEI